MKTQPNPKVDADSSATYFRLDDSRIVESEVVQDGVVFDYNDKDQVVGIELHGDSKNIEADHLLKLMESIQIGLDDIEAGRVSKVDFTEIKRMGRERLT